MVCQSSIDVLIHDILTLMKRHVSCFRFLLILLTVLSLASCSEKPISKQEIRFDTMTTITVYPENNSNAQAALDKAFARLGEVEGAANIYDKNSELSKINASIDSRFSVSNDLYRMLRLGLEWNTATAGTFDIGIGAIVQAWSIGKRNVIPSSETLIRVRAVSNLSGTVVKDGGLRFGDNKAQLDINGLAKGYAADKAMQTLRNGGLRHGLINMGSTVVAFGGKPDSSLWKIGIQHPRKENEILGTLNVKDAFIGTSGDYQQYFIKKGIRYHHIFDPKTSAPSMNSMAVTVVTHDNAAIADILSTTVFIMGPIDGLKLMERLPETEGMVVGKDGKIVMTSGFREIYKPRVNKVGIE